MGLLGLFGKKKMFKGSWSYNYYTGEGGLEQGFFLAMALLNKSAKEAGFDITDEPYTFQGLYVFDFASGGHISIYNEYMNDGMNFVKFDMGNTQYTEEDWLRFIKIFEEKLKSFGTFTGNMLGVSSKRKD